MLAHQCPGTEPDKFEALLDRDRLLAKQMEGRISPAIWPTDRAKSAPA